MVRAKFEVTERREYSGNPKMVTIIMRPVYTGSQENQKFWEATPSGMLEMTCVNEGAASELELGKEYYIDFIPSANAPNRP